MAALFAPLLIGAAPRTVTGETQQPLQPLLACRAESDPAKRLACYDRAADALGAAADRRDIIVVDKGEVQKARRSLFGFSIPSLKLFDTDGDGGHKEHGAKAAMEPEQDEITATIRSARQDSDGYWIVVLDDGATWHQVNGTMYARPRPGTTVVIKRAALGSYFLRVGKSPGVKARREG